MRDAAPLLTLLLLATPSLVQAQAPAPPAPPTRAAPDDNGSDDEIVVNGQRQRGAVIGDIPPEVQLSPADIRSYGVSSVTDLLNELAPQTTSGRGGTPVVLLNGRRISGLAEIRDLPTEAIQRVDILPEEVALKYGYSADQKVVNFVLRRRFHAITGELTGSTSTEGGGEVGRIESSLLKIDKAGRLNLSVDYQNSASLLESQRDITSAGTRLPYALAGNVAGIPLGSEIDPALSAIAGQTVTVAGVPVAAATGRATLAQFAGAANTTPNTTDVRDFRTLRPATDQLTIDAVLNRTILGNVSATFSGSYGATGSDALRGLPGTTLTVPAGNPFSPFAGPVGLYRYIDGQPALAQSIAGETQHAGVTLNGDIAKWMWTFTGNYDRAVTRTRSDTGIDVSGIQSLLNAGSSTLNPFGPFDAGLIGARAVDRARAESNTGDAELTANGTLIAVPAGDVSTTVKLGAGAIYYDSTSTRSGLVQSADLSRRSANAQVNFDLPLTSRRNNFLGVVGDLSANFNGAVNYLSDFGTLKTYGYGLTWKPLPKLSLIWSVTDDENAPTVQQLGDPQVATAAVRVFDYLRGTTVDVTSVSGGNPALTANHRHITKLGATWQPFDKPNVTITSNYIRNRTNDAIATLPSPTAAIEAAFPDRFIRDADGNLLRIDARPVNYDRTRSEQLRTGINISIPLKTSQRVIDAFRAAREKRDAERRAKEGTAAGGAQDQQSVQNALRDAAPGDRPPGGQGGAGGQGGGPRPDGPSGGPGGPGGGPRGPGGPGGFGGRGGGGGGRIQFALYHTWMFRNDILIRQGLPVLDLLNGAASGAAGGQPRHMLEGQAGITNNGLGARISVNWQAGTFVRGGSGASPSDLSFGALTTANLRLFANLGGVPSLAGKGWAQGLRISLSVNNLFNQRLDVRDATGATPLGYQPAYLDPIGREVRISIRKLLF